MSLYTKFCGYNDKKLDGIFSFMTNRTGFLNLNEHGVVKITASSVSCPISRIFDESNNWFASNNENKSWIMFDFLKNKVSISSYTMRYYLHDSLKEWIIYGSDDKKRWDIIDHKQNDKVLSNNNDKLDNYYYETQFPMMRRYIKYQSIQGRLSGDNFVVLHRIDFFGVFYYSKDILKMTCFVKNRYMTTSFACSILLLIT